MKEEAIPVPEGPTYSDVFELMKAEGFPEEFQARVRELVEVARQADAENPAGSPVKCVGVSGDNPCGYTGGKSGGNCPDCGGMLLSEQAVRKAAALREFWVKED